MSSKIIKNSCLTGLTLQQYIQSILNTLKSVAFHEFYMENQRQQLCKIQFFDHLTAFKAIDSFRHNKLVGFQLKSFLQLEQNGKVNVTQDQCQEALTCINKSLLAVTYKDFQQITLPFDVSLRNISLARYNNLEVGVGTMSKIYEVKSTSSKKISQYFSKEIQFYRQLLLRKQDFCQKYGGDIYTLSQQLCKGKKNMFNFQQFYNFCRGHKFYFNKDEFIAIYKRTKSVSHQSPLAYDDISKICIQIQSLSSLLLASPEKLGVKEKIRIIDGKSFDNLKQPSYKSINFKSRQLQMLAERQLEQKQREITELRLQQNRDQRDIRYRLCYPQQFSPWRQRTQISQLNKKWQSEVQKMSPTQINIRYSMLNKKHYFL